MARDRASIRLDMWADENWRDLTEGAQHLYMLILSHPTLSYAGVAEWRPGRLAAMTKGKTADKIKQDAAELVGHTLIVVDESTEEVLVRSFIKHDGLMKQPKLVVSMANAFAAVASKTLRMVIAFEVQKLRDREPDLKAWGVKQVQTVLDSTGKPAADLTPGFTPGVTLDFTPGFTPNDGQSLGLPTTTATATATSSKEDTLSPSARELEMKFDQAYSHWPKKVERKQALERFKKSVKTIDPDHLVEDIQRFGQAYARTTEKQFVPALGVWLNGERWTDELPGAPVTPTGRPKRVFNDDDD